MTAPAHGVRRERRGSTLVIAIDRPAQRNAIDAAMSAAMAEAFTEFEESPELAVAVLHGVGGHFSAGMDLKAFARGERMSVDHRGFGGLVEQPPSKPVIAAVEGWALGGGFELVLACDLAVAGRGARFGLPEVRRGLAARGGGAFRLPRRVPSAIALEILLTGEPIDAERAAGYGLVNRVVDDGKAVDAALGLAALIARNAPLSLAATKRAALQSRDWPLGTEFAQQRQIFEPVFASADAREGALAFQERRDAVWTGR